MALYRIVHLVVHYWLELGSLALLGLSLWIAFGPMRHRLPKLVTRFGKYSATLKLLTLSGLCWFGLYKCLTDNEPSAALNWLLGSLGVILLAGAAYVFTRKQGIPVRHAPRHDKPLPRLTSAGDASSG
jgi:hypothetical protein